jgi:hypothetical protein
MSLLLALGEKHNCYADLEAVAANGVGSFAAVAAALAA